MLADLNAAAGGGRNVMPLLLDAARVPVSEGEIVEALQQRMGRLREQPVL